MLIILFHPQQQQPYPIKCSKAIPRAKIQHCSQTMKYFLQNHTSIDTRRRFISPESTSTIVQAYGRRSSFMSTQHLVCLCRRLLSAAATRDAAQVAARLFILQKLDVPVENFNDYATTTILFYP